MTDSPVPYNRNGALSPVEHLRPVATPARVGQATAVEQSRAVAEVQAAVLVAQQCPRSVDRAVADMRRSCSEMALAQRAFFRFSRGGSQVSGASVYLARELARCWGNIDYGVGEMRRDDDAAQSEMRAWAWDQETNARASSTFIVPHMRDKRGGPERLVDLRDIYENNANQGARRVREAIFSVLPGWYVEEAKDLCTKTLERGDGRPLGERIEQAIKLFGALGVSADQMERKLGRPQVQWNARDLGELTTVYQSIGRGEANVDDEFPPIRVTADEVLANATQAPAPAPAEPPPAPPVAEPEPTPEPPASTAPEAEAPITVGQLIDAAKTGGKIPASAPLGAARKALLTVAEDLTGASFGTADDLAADQQAAEELLAKLGGGQ